MINNFLYFSEKKLCVKKHADRIAEADVTQAITAKNRASQKTLISSKSLISDFLHIHQISQGSRSEPIHEYDSDR